MHGEVAPCCVHASRVIGMCMMMVSCGVVMSLVVLCVCGLSFSFARGDRRRGEGVVVRRTHTDMERHTHLLASRSSSRH